MKKDYLVLYVFVFTTFNVDSSKVCKFFDLTYESDIRQFIHILGGTTFSTFLQERLNDSFNSSKYLFMLWKPYPKLRAMDM